MLCVGPQLEMQVRGDRNVTACTSSMEPPIDKFTAEEADSWWGHVGVSRSLSMAVYMRNVPCRFQHLNILVPS